MASEEPNKQIENDTQSEEFVFMREEIKSRPINRKHLARNTLLAAISALVFGLVACVTFALLAPFVLDRLAPEEEPEEVPVIINFPEETVEEEMTPEDMLTVADEEQEEAEENAEMLAYLEEKDIENILSSITFTVNDYQELYRSMAEIAEEAMRSMVRVTPVKSGTDIFNNIYQYDSELSGLIVADSEENLYIATRYSAVKGFETIVVTFVNDIQAEAELFDFDSNVDICVLTVSKDKLNEMTKEKIKIVSFSSSASATLIGSPVIAIGTPMGNYGSVNYGIVTSNTGSINVTDNIYKQVVTNIYGSQNASGVIINLKGDVLAYTDAKFATSDTKNIICGIGITELRRTIERLVSGVDTVLLGINCADVPSEAILLGIPDGCYVTSVGLDTPALYAGIQSGDVITKIGDVSITRFAEFLNAIRNIPLDTDTTITIKRNVQDTYKEMVYNISFSKYNK